MSDPAIDCYLICATPRTGSTLLCGLLESSGVAGHPASYFNRRSLQHYADEWQIDRPRDGRIDEAFVRAAITAGRTPNGVFGCRIMGETMPELLADLSPSRLESGAGDADLLSARFGRLRYVHLRRRDVVAQAVSWAKALQTHFWHADEEVLPGGEPAHYDEELIDRLTTEIKELEKFWARWFISQGITAHEVVYEDLAADPIGTAGAALEHLGLELPADRRLAIGYDRQADQVNADWVARFSNR